MGNPPLFVGLLINGVAYAAIFIVVAPLIRRFVGEFAWRAFLVLFLFIAAGVYVVLAVFGGMALLGMRGSLGWIVAAWALHPLWDVGLHYLGPGRPFVPETYTVACLSLYSSK